MVSDRFEGRDNVNSIDDYRRVKETHKGSYAVVLQLSSRRKILVGKLGLVDFPKGHYIYFGSALGGIKARVDRHLRQNKKIHWHADYLSSKTPWEYAWQLADGKRWECVWASQAIELSWVESPVSGFGSSDCRCESHLVRVDNATRVRDLLSGLVPGPYRLTQI